MNDQVVKAGQLWEDNDPRVASWTKGGRRRLRVVAVGQPGPKAVNAATKTLVERGAIRVKVVAAPGRNATYELNFADRTVHGERAPSQDIDQSNGARLPDTTVHAQPTNGARSASQTVHAHRAPEEYEEEVRTKPKEEIQDVDLTVTPTRATAEPDVVSAETPHLRLVGSEERHRRTTGIGWCLACHAAGKYVVAVDEVSGDACKAHLVIDGRAS